MAIRERVFLPDGREISRVDFQDILRAAFEIPSFLGDIERFYDNYLKDMEFFARYPRDGLPLTDGRTVQTQKRKRWYLEHGFPTHAINKVYDRHPLDLLQMTETEVGRIHGIGGKGILAILDFQKKYRDQIPERARRRVTSESEH